MGGTTIVWHAVILCQHCHVSWLAVFTKPTPIAAIQHLVIQPRKIPMPSTFLRATPGKPCLFCTIDSTEHRFGSLLSATTRNRFVGQQRCFWYLPSLSFAMVSGLYLPADDNLGKNDKEKREEGLCLIATSMLTKQSVRVFVCVVPHSHNGYTRCCCLCCHDRFIAIK